MPFPSYTIEILHVEISCSEIIPHFTGKSEFLTSLHSSCGHSLMSCLGRKQLYIRGILEGLVWILEGGKETDSEITEIN